MAVIEFTYSPYDILLFSIHPCSVHTADGKLDLKYEFLVQNNAIIKIEKPTLVSFIFFICFCFAAYVFEIYVIR